MATSCARYGVQTPRKRTWCASTWPSCVGRSKRTPRARGSSSRRSASDTGFAMRSSLDRVGARLGALAVLRRVPAAHADGPDDLLVGEQRNAPLDGNRVWEGQDGLSPAHERVLERLGGALELSRGARLLLGDANAAGLGIVHAFEVDQVACRIDNGHGHHPAVLLRLRDGCRGRLSCDLDADVGAVAIRHVHLRKGSMCTRCYASRGPPRAASTWESA